ncbi:MAG: DEAD/DEAH box helicase [Desulfohalobiaceae bacterium]|nr:DEAD/DEAH box helicase [Desulfohalobiaceae bacterium]
MHSSKSQSIQKYDPENRAKRSTSRSHVSPSSKGEQTQKFQTDSQIKARLNLGGVFANLSVELQDAIIRQGYTKPTPIQEQSIEYLLQRRDLLGCAQTGTGKTAAFVLPLLQHLQSQNRRCKPGSPRALIMAPTRELAGQVGESIAAYGRFLRISQTTIFGGVGQNPQVRSLRRGVDIVTATPGRLLDLMQQGMLRLDSVETFVLDEADRMLDMGFLPDIRRIMQTLPAERQSLLFSATLPKAIVELAGQVVKDPVRVSIAPEQPAVEKISQKVYYVENRDKLALLTKFLRDRDEGKVLVFAEMKHMANRITGKLSEAGIPATAIHGNKSQKARTQALAQFKNGSTRVLVATDIAARGLDVKDISHVINFNLPREAETYVHRIGRTARAGAAGCAVSFCSTEESGMLGRIERLLRQKVPVDKTHSRQAAMTRSAAQKKDLPAGRKRARPGTARTFRK